MKQFPQHIQDQANAMLAKGAKMSFDAICEMFMKKEEKLAKKNGSKKEAAKWAQRELVKNIIPTGDIAAINRKNAENNLPSSMRK